MKEQWAFSVSVYHVASIHCQESGRWILSLAASALIMLLALSSCSYPEHIIGSHNSKDKPQGSEQTGMRFPLDGEDYQIYSVILDAQVTRGDIDKIVISDHTLKESFDSESILRNGKAGELILQVLSSQIIADFNRKNESEYLLSKKFSPVRNLDLILVDERTLFSQQSVTRDREEWNIFFKRFPDSQGLFSFSRIGYNESKNQALVYFSNSAGVDEAAGALAYLEKIQGKWVIKHSLQLWVT